MKSLSTSLLLLVAGSSLWAQLLPVDSTWVGQTLKSMTLDEKIGQLFFPASTSSGRTLEWIQKYNIGGIWFARAEAKKIAEDLNAFQRASKYPILVTVDFEKGAGTYVDGATDLPINMALGASRDPNLVYQAARLTAKEARALGVHLNYAPVLDVNNNPRNPVINTRSYGEDPKLVATLATAAIKGYQENGLLATGKHFPGHGNTGTDTHAKIGVIASSPQEFESVELYPYKEVLRKAKPSSIMSAHLWIQSIDTDTIPATLSKNVMTDLLRDRLHFDGLVFTDAMVMGGITTRYPFGVATVKALQAGCDIILFPGDLEKGIDAVREAIRSGELTEQRIDESVRRVLRAKTRVGLQRNRLTDVNKIPGVVGTAAHYQMAKKIAARCLTLAKDDARLIPVRASRKVLVLTMGNKEGNSMMSRGLVTFPDEVRKLSPGSTELRLSDSMRTDEIEQALGLARQADVVLVAAYVRIVLSSGTVDLPAAHAAFLQRLLKENPHLALISFGNPYIGAAVPGIPTYICAYDNAKVLQEAAAEALFGKAHLTGKLPITISETMKFGAGLRR
ncbi:MAG: glycoside hydrolase family 3 N-terminal domain-containing protein [Ignavibacteria bacterium]|nr:glycoside hydrolase family 3 N-terminal domain-containing protein [Ignavibacteria bacterium]